MNWFIPIFMFFTQEPNLTLVYKPHHVVLYEMAQNKKRMYDLRIYYESPGVCMPRVRTDTLSLPDYIYADTIVIIKDTLR